MGAETPESRHRTEMLSHLLLKVAEHNFVSLRVYVICQIMAKERLRLTS